MEIILKLNRWANAHTNVVTDTLRVLFGIFIFYKGLLFLDETEYLYNTLKPVVSGEGTYFVLVHYVALAHICGGVFIAMGLITRLAALAQLPILTGAVLINFMGTMNVPGLVQASIGMALCAFFIFYGSGKHSVDHSLRLHM
ncbi:MAG TPA: DoxX family membrane protein [Bacteroidia bacterium]|jgi:putative oxidoreductase|nr:DoxX family membrane protein [Bacteroidia bacterium]